MALIESCTSPETQNSHRQFLNTCPTADPKVTQQWRNIPFSNQERPLLTSVSAMVQRPDEEMLWGFLRALIFALQDEQKFLLLFCSFSTVEKKSLGA